MAMKDIDKRRSSIVGVLFTPGVKAADRFHFDLDEKECAALGYAIIQWAYLEQAIFTVTDAIATALGQALPPETKSDAFRPRLRAFLDMANLIPDEKRKKYFIDLHARITNANADRQHLVHGIWSFDLGDPAFLIVDNPGTATGAPKLFNLDAIIAFAEKVSQISMALLYPDGLTIEDVAKAREGEGLIISRQGLKMLTGR